MALWQKCAPYLGLLKTFMPFHFFPAPRVSRRHNQDPLRRRTTRNQVFNSSLKNLFQLKLFATNKDHPPTIVLAQHRFGGIEIGWYELACLSDTFKTFLVTSSPLKIERKWSCQGLKLDSSICRPCGYIFWLNISDQT